MSLLPTDLGRWYPVLWVLFGLAPPVIGATNEPAGVRATVWVAVVVLGLTYVGVVRSGSAARWPFSAVLTAVIGTLAVLSAGAEALFVVSLPLYWSESAGTRSSLAWSAAGALMAVGPGIGSWWGGGYVPLGTPVVVAGFLAGAGLGVWGHRLAAHAARRADRLDRELASTQRELAETHQRQGAAEERERLSREIHDTLAQGLASIIALAAAARTAVQPDPGSAERRLDSIEATARENLAEARVLVTGAEEGATQASISQLLRLAAERLAADTGIDVHIDLTEVPIGRAERLALLRCSQESLANVRRHSGASTVSITLTADGDRVDLEIVDDGRGFAITEAEGFGLVGMARRMAELGGLLTVTSSPRTGTRILASLARAQERGES
ncbi:sensor histidine kinase [Actinomycetospora sp. NBC_00405]|uniref:sensor histidine kinase n=1 Tax=Actinomycetospora sp. NBC_00405 TaxID=2975952 RepID=UPI002E1F444B